MKATQILLLAALAAMLTGCARVAATTTLKADGSFDRKVVYSLSTNSMAPSGKAPVFSEFFALPPAGGGVVNQRTSTDSDSKLTVTRHIAAGSAPLQDIKLLAKDGKPLLAGKVTVTTLSSGNLEYNEDLTWLGAKEKADLQNNAQFKGLLKQALPEKYRDAATVNRVQQLIFTEIVHDMFGPPHPSFVEFFADPDAAELRFKDLFVESLEKVFQGALPEMTDQERKQSLQELILKLDPSKLAGLDAMKKPPSLGGQPKEASNSMDENNGMTALLFVVSFPGKIVETNGLVTKSGDKVYWSLYPMSVATGVVRLHLVVQPKP